MVLKGLKKINKQTLYRKIIKKCVLNFHTFSFKFDSYIKLIAVKNN